MITILSAITVLFLWFFLVWLKGFPVFRLINLLSLLVLVWIAVPVVYIWGDTFLLPVYILGIVINLAAVVYNFATSRMPSRMNDYLYLLGIGVHLFSASLLVYILAGA